MLRQSLPLPVSESLLSVKEQHAFHDKDQDCLFNEELPTVDRSMLTKIVQENHYLYPMEKRDRPNNSIRVLVALHKMNATEEQLSIAYENTLQEVESIFINNKNTRINERNWQDHLGNTSFYGDFLVFFDHQLNRLGLDELLSRYFYSIPYSMGSQLQPFVQLAFGIEQELPEIITQALAYYACTYMDVSTIILPKEEAAAAMDSHTPTAAHPDRLDFVNTFLFDLVRSDQRFDGRIDGDNTFQQSIKVLLKSKQELLQMYMAFWTKSTQAMSTEQKMDALVYTAVCLVKYASRPHLGHTEMDWFLTGGQLIESALALKKLANSNESLLQAWVPLQFLAMLCSFVVQGRPYFNPPQQEQHPLSTTALKMMMSHMDQHISHMMRHAHDDPKLVLALHSLMNVKTFYPHFAEEALYVDIIQLLSSFSMDGGVWVKSGLGWK
ncbi:hypothetical protein BDF20DRAFT_863653 [Mycotypha africana]|uniref:uncharacterized protein n=1 Tax=Mycotypha africana TaxID=64632 RepID=UPI0022FFDACF|nr:uncharacterized protein BDF20DRAFT_863653 [Mycotypha africana]KAI8981865.1 hypothetical protein BDF20DRAFT_863653 [Mycotypha africana]